MEDSNDTPPPPSTKRRGRVKGKKYKAPSSSRFYSFSIAERARLRVNPDLLIDYHLAILQGINPIFEPVGDNEWRVIPDPSPSAGTPTLQQKTDSARWLTDRRDGMAPQAVHIEAMLKAQVQPEIPQNILDAINPLALKKLAEAFALPEKTDTSDAIDAEFSEVKEAEESNNK